MNDAPANSASWIQIAVLEEFQGQRQIMRVVGGLEVLLLRVGGDIIAVNNHCTHLGKSLQGGRIMGTQLTCPFHGACFDLKSGAALSGPAVAPLHLFPARIDGENILVDLSKRPGKSTIGFGGDGPV